MLLRFCDYKVEILVVAYSRRSIIRRTDVLQLELYIPLCICLLNISSAFKSSKVEATIYFMV
ncbi:hypothetical protein Plhal304r1_c040g0118951 [Plasmopara halstedii]